MFIVCWVGRGLCDELITRPKESYRVSVGVGVGVCVCVRASLMMCDLETSKI